METEDSFGASSLSKEFTDWLEKHKDAHALKLMKSGICEDGRVTLNCSWGPTKDFVIFCPQEYPDYDGHFYVEADSSLQFWCNALNEYLLDSEKVLSLEDVLSKAWSLYYPETASENMSSSDSEDMEDETPEAEEYMVVDGFTMDGDDFDFNICLKKKRWRQKEAEVRAAMKQPKISDMFEGTVKDHPQQIFSNSGASGILTNDLVSIMGTAEETGISAEPIDDNIYQWSVRLSKFDPKSDLEGDLRALQTRYGYSFIELQLDFTIDLYPFYPPVVKVVRPRLQGSMMLCVSSLKLLKLTYWNAARDMKSVLQEIKSYLQAWTRLDVTNERNDLLHYPSGAYLDIENALLRLAWVSEIPSRANMRFPTLEQETAPSVTESVPKRAKTSTETQKSFPAGTGYSTWKSKGWDVRAYVAAQNEKDKKIESVLKMILDELQKHRKQQRMVPDVQFQRFQKNTLQLDDTYTSFTFPSTSSVNKDSSNESVAKDSGADMSFSEERLETVSLSAETRHRPFGSVCSVSDVNTTNCDIPLSVKSHSSNNVGQEQNVDRSLVDSGMDITHGASSSVVSPVDPIDDLFGVLEASSLVPFLEMKLGVDSFLEISQHASVYRCVVDIVNEIASVPKLVPLLWNLPEQNVSLFSRIVKVEKQASILLRRIASTAANGSIPTATGSGLAIPNSHPTEPPEERLARDYCAVYVKINEALKAGGFFAESRKGQDGSTEMSAELPVAADNSDEALAARYKEILKEYQFLSCDIEVDGANAHSYSNEFKKALMPKSSQNMRIAQEMTALSSSLPLDFASGIFVRTDDSKYTLLRALIIGPEGTPYSGGCFQFDIYFPSTYPSSPPLVHLCTTGHGNVRFNPNLYSNGKVCLSLLGTWKGVQGEQWTETSTLLQVLISIQSLIFVEQPYFNEPGYESSLGTAMGKKASDQYNEDVIVHTVKYAMIEQMIRPCSGFEDVIKRHFQLKKDYILKEVRDNMKKYQSKTIEKAYQQLLAEFQKMKPFQNGDSPDGPGSTT